MVGAFVATLALGVDLGIAGAAVGSAVVVAERLGPQPPGADSHHHDAKLSRWRTASGAEHDLPAGWPAVAEARARDREAAAVRRAGSARARPHGGLRPSGARSSPDRSRLSRATCRPGPPARP